MSRKRRLRILARVGWWSRNRAEEEREKEWGEMATTFLAWDIQLTMERMVSKSYQQNSGPFSIVSSFLHESNERQTKRERSTTKRKKNGQIKVAVEQVGEQRMQVDGFTAGVSLTERISGGFNIKAGRSNQSPSLCCSASCFLNSSLTMRLKAAVFLPPVEVAIPFSGDLPQRL